MFEANYFPTFKNSAIRYDFSNKDAAVRDIVGYMLDRTQSMFQWDGLPDTIPQRSLELFLQINGCVGWFRLGDNIYMTFGGLGGEPDHNYMPTVFTVANPALKYSANLKIGTDCVVMPNDSVYKGLIPLLSRYATMINENEITLRLALVNLRATVLLSAQDDPTAESARRFLSDLDSGKPGVIGENAFLDGIKAQPYAHTGGGNRITDLLETEQYTKASWFNELGLNANYNMKRESITSSESNLNDDALLPLVDNMLRCRKEAAEEINKLFGTDITVDFASAWEDNQEELEAKQDGLEGKEPEGDEKDEKNPE